ncbi:MAG TPA: protein-glutamate O-methyltransferase [Azospirillum sp.]
MFDQLSERNYQRLAQVIHAHSGIRMPPAKRTMVEGRLRKRLRALDVPSLDEYCSILFDRDGLKGEFIHLIDAVTTNKTDFFREPDHFRYLAEEAAPRLRAERRAGVDRPLKAWSAACSCGAEPYTLAMVLADAEQRRGVPGGAPRFSILGTDICTQVLEQAVAAVYPADMIAPVPPEMRRRYLLRARDPARREVRIAPELRRHVRFARLNLMDARYPVDQDMDVIFCRNILIYFEKDAQQAVLNRLCRHLRPGGYLFLGHAESMIGADLPVRPVAATVFRRA